MKKRTVIVGGVAGGASCAARLRRLDEERDILLLERGEYISYANCGLPYHVGDVIKDRDDLLLFSPELMRERFRIDVRTGHEVLKIDREGKTVTVRDRKDGSETEEHYDELVLSTGSHPMRPPIPGIDSEKVRTLWTVPDADKIRQMARNSGIGSAAVIGGGFIGLEIAENLREDGLNVSIVEAMDQVLPPIDLEMAKLVQEEIVKNGVHLYLNDPVEKFEDITEGGKEMVRVTTGSGASVTAELVVLSIGIRPNTELAKDAGLELNERGFVVVGDDMRTSDPSIFAVGDIVETEDIVTGGRGQYQLAGPANKQGRVAADQIAALGGVTGAEGFPSVYKGTQGTSIAKVFRLAAGMTGQSEKALIRAGKKEGRDYDKVYVKQNQHAGYYPGAVPMMMKLLFTPDGSRILGAQIVGKEGVDKRIDTIAEAIRFKAKATDLADLECAYAPPFSSAKDPVNMAGFVIKNRLNGFVKFAEWDTPDKEKDAQLLDVREDGERKIYSIPGAVGIPLGTLRESLDRLDKKKPVVVFCAIGVRAYNAARILQQNGFEDVRVYPGGAGFYRSTHYDA